MMPSTEKLAQGNGMMSGFLATAAICSSRILQNEVSFSTLTDKMKLKWKRSVSLSTREESLTPFRRQSHTSRKTPIAGTYTFRI